VFASRDGNLGDGIEGEIADLAEPESLIALFDRVQPDVIVNAAAYTAVDRAEDFEALATTINADAVQVMGTWAARTQALVVHYSTDYVFNGQGNQPYDEDAPTNPIGAYGRSKLAGELALRISGAPHLIFRTAWVYASHGKNFLITMLKLGEERNELRVVADQIGVPTPAGLISFATAHAIDRWGHASAEARSGIEGTYHLVSSGQTSWHGFAEAILAKAATEGLITRQPVVSAISTAEFPTRATRPAYSVLDNTLFQQTFHVALPAWEIGLDDVLLALNSRH
jgi:dTDP-4-dehydrorhamnose reductase